MLIIYFLTCKAFLIIRHKCRDKIIWSSKLWMPSCHSWYRYIMPHLRHDFLYVDIPKNKNNNKPLLLVICNFKLTKDDMVMDGLLIILTFNHTCAG